MSGPNDRGIVVGRNYIETLVLTLTKIEFTAPSTDILVRIVLRLEDEVCALSSVVPEAKAIYLETFRRMLKEYFGKSLPVPETLMDRCNICQSMLEYLLQNPSVVVEGRHLSSETEEKIKSGVARVGRASIFTTFYVLGLIKV